MKLLRLSHRTLVAAITTACVACATPAPNDDEEEGRTGAADARSERDIGSTPIPDASASLDAGSPRDAASGADAVLPDADPPDADGTPADTGTPDAGAPDTSTPDAGTPDTGTPDAGAPDAGTPDTGTPDAGTPDAGTPDAGTPDTSTPEICNNRTDDDGDSRVDCDDVDCADDPACTTTAFEVCNNRLDDDGDGRVDCDDADCAGDPSCVTTAFEVCNNRLDDDGDGRVDCDDTDCVADPACGTTGGDACADALVATLGTNTGALRGQPSSLFSPLCGGNGPEQVWTFVAPESRTYCAQTAGSSFDTVLYVRTVCDAPGSEETCNDDTGGLQSEVEFRALAGETLSVIVDAFNPGTNGTISLTITNEPCSIVVADPEICDDGIDNDRDFFTDCRDTDCDDDPACQEICDDGVDNDGDFSADCRDPDCDGDPACQEICDDGIDNDGDFSADCRDPDCDGDPACQEICDDGVDNDGDFSADCSDSDCADDPNCRPGGTVCEDALTAVVGTQLGDVGTGRSRMSGTCGGSGGPEQAWSFTARRAGAYCVDTFGSGFDTVLYARNTCETSSTQFACDDDTDGPQSQLELTLAIGQRITLFVDAYSSSPAITGYGLNIFEGTCAEAYPEICDDGTDNDGDFDTDCYDDDCADAPNCQEICDDDIDNDRDFRWDCNDPDCEGDPACNELVCDDGVDNDDDFWTDCADDDCDDDPACQPFTCATPLSYSGFGTLSGDASNGDTTLNGTCGGNGREAVIAWTPTASGTVCIDTQGSTYDTVLYARSTCTSSSSQLACNDDAPGISPRSEIAFDATAGVPVYVVVDAYSFSSGGAFEVNFRPGDCGP